MSDSDKTNELDNYGVWVKKPPRTVSSEIGEENTAALSDTDDLPDFASIDVVDSPLGGEDPNADETTLSADELANISGASAFADALESESASSGETEEISLDEFIDGGVFDGDDTASAASPEPSQSATTASSQETVPVDDFMESSDITISDSPSVSDAPAISDDGPIDIDLSFDDSDSMPATGGGSSVSSAPVKEVAGSEEVDLSDFGVDFGDGDSSSSSSASPEPSSDGTESVDLSDFGVDFGDGDSSSQATAESTVSSEPVINEDGTEEVSLDSFGFDINEEESKDEPSSQAESDGEPSESEDFSPSLSEESVSLSDATDDDVGDISIEASPSAAPVSSPAQDFGAQDSDDFDLDSIMDSIEDENGNTSSLNDNASFMAAESGAETAAPASQEPATVETPVTESESSSIEETVAEEPVVNDIVDLDEPVFEETAVDIPESTETESENPFELPADDEFATPIAGHPADSQASITEESTVAESSVSFGEEAPVSDEPVFAETVTAVSEDSSASKPLADEPAPDSHVSAKASEEPKQDAEISSATNSILSQIASELSSLRNEISNLKNEFEELKNKDAGTHIAETPEEITANPAEQESSGGFFGTEDEDDTIALSLDEMDNILNTVEIVEEEAPAVPESASVANEEETVFEPESPATEDTAAEGESLDFATESLEEPILDDIDTNIADEELPEEILVPKSEDDILVESSQENLIGEEPESPVSIEESNEELTISEPDAEADSSESEDISFEIADRDSDSGEDTLLDEPFVFDETEQSEGDLAEDSNDVTLSADELANIAADSSETEESESLSAAEESSQESESSIPSVSDILGDTAGEESEETSGISISEGELDTLLSSEAAKPHIEEEEEKSEPVQSSIPNNLQKEIKSVLSYMDQLLENLPEEKIAEFAQSEQFETYKKLFKELGLD